MTEPVLEARGIVKRFPGVVANDGIELVVRRRHIHATATITSTARPQP